MASGSIQKRIGKRGVRWTVVYDDPHAVGKRKQRRKTFGTKKEGEAFLAKTLDQINSGGFIEPSGLTVSAYFDQWLDTYAKHNVRPTTYRNYAQLVRVHIGPALGAIELQKLQPAHLQSFYSLKLESGRADGKPGGLSPSTVHYLHRLIREALGQALKWGLVVRNVADATEPPRPQRPEPKVWSSEQAGAFLTHVEQADDFYNPLWHLALATGMRRGELLGVRWQDVDLDKGLLRVRQNLIEIHGEILYQEPKTRSGRRTVALLDSTVERLRAHRRQQLEQRMEHADIWEDLDLVFCTESGGPLRPSNVGRHLRRLMVDTGLPQIGFHGLRHTHATMLLKDGVHLKIASERLGHASISLTADTYSHVLPDMQRQALKQVDESVFETLASKADEDIHPRRMPEAANSSVVPKGATVD